MNKPNTLAQALGLIETILSETPDLSKPRRQFLLWMFSIGLGLPVRRNMLNLARFGPYCEKSIRLGMARAFNFAEFCGVLRCFAVFCGVLRCFAVFCGVLIAGHCGAERICAFDPSFIRKAGRHTYGVDHWWCGTLQKAVRGLELGVLGVVDGGGPKRLFSPGYPNT